MPVALLPPEHIKAATRPWYEWYRLRSNIPGNGWVFQTGLQLAGEPFAQLDRETFAAVDREMASIGDSKRASQRIMRLPLLIAPLFQKWRPRIDSSVPDWFLEGVLKARLMRCKLNRIKQKTRGRPAPIIPVETKEQEDQEMSFEYEDNPEPVEKPMYPQPRRHFVETPKPYHNSLHVRRPRPRQLDTRNSLPRHSSGRPQGLSTPSNTHIKTRSTSRRKSHPARTPAEDEYQDIVLSEAPSELDISSFGPGQTVSNGRHDVDQPRDLIEDLTEYLFDNCPEDDASSEANARISTSPGLSTASDEAPPPKTLPPAASRPPSHRPLPTSPAPFKPESEPPSSSPKSTISRRQSASPTPSSCSPSSSSSPPPTWSCLCGHPTQPPEKRDSNYLCVDHSRWIPRKQLTVYAQRNKKGRQACWTASKFRACACGYPDEAEGEVGEKNWLCREHRRWVPRNRLAIVEDWV